MNTNRRALIDNATLSGVERMLGISKAYNLSNIDNDILCLEKLITAILFSDKIISVDDYKDEHRSARIKNFDFIEFFKLEQQDYIDISEDAAEFARSMTFSFKGTKPAGDVVSFFKSLRIDPQLRWDIFVSSEYLTLSFLVDNARHAPYETAIDGIFRSETADRTLSKHKADHTPSFSVKGRSDIDSVKELVQAFKSENPQFSGEQTHSALHQMVFGYGWVAERSYFYNKVAHLQKSDAYLAPLRDAFCESCCDLSYPSKVNGLLNNLKNKTQNTLSFILEPSGQSQFALRLPFFSAYLISKTGNPKECIELALKLREERDFKDCRSAFHNFHHLSEVNKLKEINGIFNHLDQACTKLMKKYAVSTGNGLQYSLSFGIAGPEFSIEGKLGTLFRAYKHQPFARVFRNIAQDMLNVERLGDLHEKICSSIHKPRAVGYPNKISTTPKFMEHKENLYSRQAKLE